MYALFVVYQQRNTLEFDGANVFDTYHTEKSAKNGLLKVMGEYRKMGYYISEQYYSTPFEREYHAEVWMKDDEDIAILCVRKMKNIS